MKKKPLYEILRDEIVEQINYGTFRPGERIPSIRQTSKQKSLSITTVLEAYQLLEAQGFIESRPQSGYYIKYRLGQEFPFPESSPSPSKPTQVNIDNLDIVILRDSLNGNLAKFGAALPDAELLPTAKLNRILGALTKEKNFGKSTEGILEGLEDLRVLIAQRAFTQGCNLIPEEIIITNGCSEAINLALMAVCNPGDLVVIESPTYFGILQALELHGLHALEIPTHPRTGISLEALAFALENHPVKACIISTNFSNPMGCTMPDQHKKELVALLSRFEIPLLEDDICGELYFSGQRPITAKSFDKKGLVMLCSSYSKDISMNYRVGWICSGRYREQIEKFKISLNIGTSLLPQYVIAQFLKSGYYDLHLRKIRKAYAEKVSRMTEAIMKIFPETTRVTEPRGGFVLWVQLPQSVDSLVLYEEALKAKITLAPGYIFSPGDKYKNFIRLNAAYWSENTYGSLERIAEIVKKLSRTDG